MSQPDVTIVITVRERYSGTERALVDLWAHTPEPFHLVYVDVNSPAPTRRYLEQAAAQHDFTLVRTDVYVSPNRARNIGVKHAPAGTDYVVFLDNDVLLTPGWLPALVECAEQTGAWAVGPLYLQGELADEVVHMAGGDMEMSPDHWGERQFQQTQRHFLDTLDQVPPTDLVRQECDIIEFHCALVRRCAFDIAGGMDEGLLTTREHLDFCLRLQAAGGHVWFEPASVITYLIPPPFEPADLPYFLLRWSDAWTRETLTHFAYKHGIRPDYVNRMIKTRGRRQHLLQGWIEPKFAAIAGKQVAAAAWKALVIAEPLVNSVLVRLHASPSSGGETVVHAAQLRPVNAT